MAVAKPTFEGESEQGAREGKPSESARGRDPRDDGGNPSTSQLATAPVEAAGDNRDPAESHEVLMARLYREHNQALIRFLMTRVDSEQEARDVAQEAYVRMLQLDSRGAVSFLSAYLFKTAANIATDRIRHRIVRRRADSELAQKEERQPSVPPETILQAREELALIDRFARELPAKCRQAFYLHRLHDMSPPDIAAQLGVTKRTVHNYLVQALTYLRMRFDDAESTRKNNP